MNHRVQKPHGYSRFSRSYKIAAEDRKFAEFMDRLH